MSPPSVGKRVAELRRQIEEHNRRYYLLDAPTITDAEIEAHANAIVTVVQEFF